MTVSPPATPAESSSPVLLVDDEPQLLLSAKTTLRMAGVSPVITLEDSRRVLPLLSETDAGVVVLDLTMPHLPGNEVLARIREEQPHIPVIVMTGRNDLDTAVQCMKAGAFDYLVKPVESSRFVSSVKRALEMRTLREELSSLKRHFLSDGLVREESFSGFVTRSKAMRAIFHYIEAVAGSGQPILITGETGVGKELVAHAIHEASGRKGRYVAVNVAGLDDPVFSDTLFGHRKGAYTGADQGREGLVAQAAGGTLFLDEVGDMKESLQVKLLRLLEERQYYPLGADVPRRSEARVVCATARDLQREMREGRFRKDLYYRLAAHQVHLPPLRERSEDLPLLLDHFLEMASGELNKKKPAPPPELVTLLSVHRFPGNVRELKTMVYDAVARHRGGVLSMDGFRKEVGETQPAKGGEIAPSVAESDAPVLLPERFPTLKETEEFLIAEALRRAKDNQGIAATLLGISRQALNKRLLRDRESRTEE